MKEFFKDIPEYEGLYQISNYGNILAFYTNKKYHKRILNPHMSGVKRRNYPQVSLYKNGIRKTFRVHYLMARTFLNYIQTDRKTVVDHIDNNPLNNKITNLQIISMKVNNTKDRITLKNV